MSATVTVATACITLGTAQIDFGTLAFNSSSTNIFGQTPTLTVRNCSATNETFLVHGTDATSNSSQARWTLYDQFSSPCSIGPNRYQVQYQNHDGTTVTGFNLTNENQTAAPTVPASADHRYRLTLLMPCAGSDGAGETMTFQTVFMATF